MAIKIQPTWTGHEVSRVLRDSEGVRFGAGDPGGHAESRHELRSFECT